MIRNLKDVVDWGLCIGCGACAAVCRRGGIRMVDYPDAGLRPEFTDPACASCSECLPVCPGVEVDLTSLHAAWKPAGDEERQLGPFLEIWEGHATDDEIRQAASSGGLLTALALHCIEHEDMAFVLHSGRDDAEPLRNKTVQSRTRAELLSRTGSRYAPASPCDGLAAIEQSDRPCVFIGKPCDATAVQNARRMRPELDRKLGLVLTFFCAGTPATRGTMDLIEKLGGDPARATSVRYRGNGWPGRFTVDSPANAELPTFSYQEAWGHLTKYRPFRCHLCADGLGRIADLSCGDAWHHYAKNGNPGLSIVIVRTERGRRILERARAAGAVTLRPIPPGEVVIAQKELLARRQDIHGRLLAMRTLGIPVPRFVGYSLREDWARLPLAERLRGILGTWKRVARLGLWRRRAPQAYRRRRAGR